MATNNSSKHNTPGNYKPEYWEAMKSQLDKEMPVRLVQKPYFKRSVLAAGIGIGLSMGWFIWSSDEKISDDIADNEIVIENVESSSISQRNKELSESNTEDILEQTLLSSDDGSSQLIAQDAQEVDAGESSINSNTVFDQNEEANDPKTFVSLDEETNQQIDEIDAADSEELNSEMDPYEQEVDNTWDLANVDLSSIEMRTLMDAQENSDKFVLSPNLDDYSDHRNPFALRDVQVIAFVGGNLSNGFSNTDIDGSFSLDYLLGLGIQKQLGIKTSFSFSAQYMRRSGHELEQTKEIITYFLDRYATLESISTSKMQFLHIPIEIRYRLGYRHHLSSGIFVSYLLNAHGERKTYFEDSQTDVELETSKAHGYIGGFAPLSYGLSFGYEYSITSFIRTGLRYNAGLNDLTINQEFKNSDFDRIHEFQIWVGIRLSE